MNAVPAHSYVAAKTSARSTKILTVAGLELSLLIARYRAEDDARAVRYAEAQQGGEFAAFNAWALQDTQRRAKRSAARVARLEAALAACPAPRRPARVCEAA
jgi:hypothetical protein